MAQEQPSYGKQRALTKLITAIFALGVNSLAGCVPHEPGVGARVENRCTTTARFVLDGGPAPDAPRTAHADVLAAGAVETYSVLVGEDQPYHLWLIDPPAAAPLVVPPDSRGRTVVLQGEPCDASIE